jgi:aspartate racemase
MHTHPLSEYMRFIDADDWNGVAALMISSAEKVAQAGADFAICPDNTIHQAFAQVIAKSAIPWLHIAEEVATEAKRQSYRRLGILGTRYLMEGPVYSEKLAEMYLDHRIPRPQERERINEIIFTELVNGLFTDEARSYFRQVIQNLKERGCDAVVLGCTEIPLLVNADVSTLPTLDSTRLLARAALRRAAAG